MILIFILMTFYHFLMITYFPFYPLNFYSNHLPIFITLLIIIHETFSLWLSSHIPIDKSIAHFIRE